MLSRLKSIIRSRGYALYSRPYELNIVGIRSKHTRSNSFDDEIHVFYKNSKGKWEYHVFPATTDPGTFWLKNPMMPEGTGILAQGQYRESYQIGLHQGKYTALVQRKPVTVLRDYDRDSLLDFFNGTKQTGFFGINVHRAAVVGTTKFIDKHSAGCQVLSNTSDFNLLMDLCKQHRNLYGNSFTYSLIDFRAIRKESYKRIAIGSLSLGLGLYAYYEYDT